MSLDTVTLSCFLAVAETGSFTKAAARVRRTQSAVSQQIAKLEDLLGVQLVERGRALRLSNEGEAFLGHARRIYEMQLAALDLFSGPELEGEVRFGLPEDFAAVFLSDVLVEFSRLHPRVKLNVVCDLTLNLLGRFKEGEFDLVLVKTSRPEDIPHGEEVWSEPLEWAGVDGALPDTSTGAPVPLVLSPQPCVYRASALAALEEAGLSWRLVFSSPSYAGTVAAVRAGLGLTVLPRTMVPATLHVLRAPGLPKLKDTHVSLLKQSPDDAAVASFEDFVLQKMR